MKNFLLACLVVTIIVAEAQVPQITLNGQYLKNLKKHRLAIRDNSDLYINDADSTALFYYALVPNEQIKGLLIILPSTTEQVEDVFNSNQKLITLAHDRDMMILVPSINNNLCLEETALQFLNVTFSDAIERYHPPLKKIVIGGFSLGGMNAIRYTEMACEDSSKTIIRPIAVYGVDPPLDLANLYYTFARTIEKNVSSIAVQEAKSYLDKMNSQFGGDPENYAQKYIHYSMYSRSQPKGGNAGYLKSIPIRIYSDPDIDWYLKNRQVDLYDMNALDQTAMINDLHHMGNDRAEFISALGKGYRSNGMRHPHSWSIVEPVDCISWIMKCVNSH
jgi:hypothetical protein